MFRHQLLLIYRNFIRFKSSFFINLIGLSSGLTCTLFIYLWVNDELKMDKFHEKEERLFQVMERTPRADGIAVETGTPELLADALADEIPEVEYATLATPTNWHLNFTLVTENKKLKPAGKFVGIDYFNVFTYPILAGDKTKILADKNGIAISESLALRLFNTTEQVVGKSIEWQLLHFKGESFISGIFKDMPSCSSEQLDFVLPHEVFLELGKTMGRSVNWDNHPMDTYITLKEGARAEDVDKKITDFIKSKISYSTTQLFLRSYSSGYLYGNYENGKQAGGRIEYVKLFSIIAIFILMIACINFMNLSTAKASRRIKEVGIKKAIGAGRRTLIIQYLGESLIMSLLSLSLAILFVDLLLPQFNLITGKQLTLDFDKTWIVSLLAITLFTSVIAGSYPALYLSGFHPATVLKGKLNTSIGELWARKGLVAFQFTLSIIFIVSVVVVYKQIEFIQNKNLGYQKENIIQFPIEGNVAENTETFIHEIQTTSGIIAAASTGNSLMGTFNTTQGLSWEGKNPDADITFGTISVNYNLIELLGIELKDGRAFSKDFAEDNSAIVINEAAAEAMGIADPVGKTINVWGKTTRIIGLARNFHFESLHEKVKPFFFRFAPQEALLIMARIEAGKESETIERLQKLYQRYNPGYSFDYHFLDQDYEAQYSAEKKVAVLSRYFAALAILISSLGLFGLAAFTAERRLKEIGIRKVLGSSEFGIIYLMSVDFTKIVLAAIIIALPVSYVITKYWLAGFAFRIELQWWYFIGAGLLALLIAWLTVGTQALKAAKVNPTQCLKEQ